MRAEICTITFMLLGAGLVVDADPTNSVGQAQATSKTFAPIIYTDHIRTGSLATASGSKGLTYPTAVLPTGTVSTSIPGNGSEIARTKIDVVLTTLAPIPAQVTWVNEYSESNWSNGTPFDNSTYGGVLSLQKHHLPNGQRTGQGDIYRGRHGVWCNEY